MLRSNSRKKFQAELDEIENGYEISLYNGNDYLRFYRETLVDALLLIELLHTKHKKGKKK